MSTRHLKDANGMPVVVYDDGTVETVCEKCGEPILMDTQTTNDRTRIVFMADGYWWPVCEQCWRTHSENK